MVYGPPVVRFDPDKIKDAVAKALEENPELASDLRMIVGKQQLGAALFNLIAPACGEEQLP